MATKLKLPSSKPEESLEEGVSPETAKKYTSKRFSKLKDKMKKSK